MIVESYEKMQEFVQRWLDGSVRFLIIESDAGLGKTSTVQQMLKDNKALFIGGHCTPLSHYKLLYRHQNCELIVLDDLTSLFLNRQNIGLLMQYCDSGELRTVSWQSTSKALEDLPQSFHVSARICVLCNHVEAQDKYVHPILDRAFHLQFRPTKQELMQKMKQITADYPFLEPTEKEAVLNVIEQNIQHVKNISLRHLVKGFWLYNDFKTKGREWKPDFLKLLGIDEKLVALNQLLVKHSTDNARLQDPLWQWSRATWYSYKKSVQETA